MASQSGSAPVKIDFDIHSNTILAEAMDIAKTGSLDSCAEFIRAHFDCHALVVRLADASAPLVAVFDGDDGGDNGALVDPVAAGRMGFGFYAGLPLRGTSGEKLGTLAMLDHEPRDFSDEAYGTLKLLAGLIAQLIETGPDAGEASKRASA